MDWRPVPGFEGVYEVSEHGKVRSLHTGRLLRPYKSGFGYLRLSLCKDGTQKHFDVHRLVARVFLGEPSDPKSNACHNDGVRTNNHYSNLRWASSKENMADKKRHGTAISGPGHFNAKLSDIEVRLIHHLVSMGARVFEVARRAGITHQHIRCIMLGKTRKGAFL